LNGDTKEKEGGLGLESWRWDWDALGANLGMNQIWKDLSERQIGERLILFWRKNVQILFWLKNVCR
jgi:hypothetical protein